MPDPQCQAPHRGRMNLEQLSFYLKEEDEGSDLPRQWLSLLADNYKRIIFIITTFALMTIASCPFHGWQSFQTFLIGSQSEDDLPSTLERVYTWGSALEMLIGLLAGAALDIFGPVLTSLIGLILFHASCFLLVPLMALRGGAFGESSRTFFLRHPSLAMIPWDLVLALMFTSPNFTSMGWFIHRNEINANRLSAMVAGTQYLSSSMAAIWWIWGQHWNGKNWLVLLCSAPMSTALAITWIQAALRKERSELAQVARDQSVWKDTIDEGGRAANPRYFGASDESMFGSAFIHQPELNSLHAKLFRYPSAKKGFSQHTSMGHHGLSGPHDVGDQGVPYLMPDPCSDTPQSADARRHLVTYSSASILTEHDPILGSFPSLRIANNVTHGDIGVYPTTTLTVPLGASQGVPPVIAFSPMRIYALHLTNGFSHIIAYSWLTLFAYWYSTSIFLMTYYDSRFRSLLLASKYVEVDDLPSNLIAMSSAFTILQAPLCFCLGESLSRVPKQHKTFVVSVLCLCCSLLYAFALIFLTSLPFFSVVCNGLAGSFVYGSKYWFTDSIIAGNFIDFGEEQYGVITGTLQLIAGVGALFNLITTKASLPGGDSSDFFHLSLTPEGLHAIASAVAVSGLIPGIVLIVMLWRSREDNNVHHHRPGSSSAYGSMVGRQTPPKMSAQRNSRFAQNNLDNHRSMAGDIALAEMRKPLV